MTETEEQTHARTLSDAITWLSGFAAARPESAKDMPSIYGLRAVQIYVEDQAKAKKPKEANGDRIIRGLGDAIAFQKGDVSKGAVHVRPTKSGKRTWSAEHREKFMAAVAARKAKNGKKQPRAQATSARVKKILKKGK